MAESRRVCPSLCRRQSRRQRRRRLADGATDAADAADDEVAAAGDEAAALDAARAALQGADEAAAAWEAAEAERARTALSGGAAADGARTLALKILKLIAADGEGARAALLGCGAHAIALRALRRQRSSGEGSLLLCGAIAQLSCTADEQAALIAAGGVAALSELYEEMSVSAMDASAAATQRELAAVLSNLVLAAPELADEVAAEGGEEALEDAASARRAVETMKPAALVARLAEGAHDGALQIAGASALRRHFEAASADGGGAACASELVAYGAIGVLGAAVRRHRHGSGVARKLSDSSLASAARSPPPPRSSASRSAQARRHSSA